MTGVNTNDDAWYKDAIIYEVHVRAYADSDADGRGDIAGLTSKLEYIKDLGVTAVWLLPFYKSPLKDDGYDIAEYTSVHEDYGTINDFKVLIEKAHRLGLKIITELVLNHTSDQHPWFQRSRTAPKGSYWHNFYTWSDAPDKYLEARIIFKDFERSNWTFDPVAGQYYWHRFYSHQPDLNFDHPPVRRRIMRIVDFWLNLGVDGLRLDAVPYLYAREGTDCENLPETHTFLKELRSHIDSRFQNRMLLAEANQWPEDARLYFGQDDECHMAFHFPLMPRLFMALQMEDRFPLVDILQQTPAIPPNCQWALFLRNHDELTLEMVTDEERDYMYRTFAKDERSRINLGIRRRLAPLLGYHRQKIELMNALLLSLPGTPVLYYGDEIGMGDNIFLGDRNGVRTPMQWNGDRNAGFSRANPQSLYSPVVIDPECHYESVNVEAQLYNPDSLLRFIKQLINLRKRYPIFGRGELSIVPSDNPSVLAFIRHQNNQNTGSLTETVPLVKSETNATNHGGQNLHTFQTSGTASYRDRKTGEGYLGAQNEEKGESVLVIANLSRYAQSVRLDLRSWDGFTPKEMFGNSSFPAITEEDYEITMGPYSFYWLLLEDGERSGGKNIKYHDINFPDNWHKIFEAPFLSQFEALLPDLLISKRWFPGKDRTISQTTILDHFLLDKHTSDIMMVVIEVAYYVGEPEQFVLAFSHLSQDDAVAFEKNYPEAIYFSESGEEGIKRAIVDAYYTYTFAETLLKNCAVKRRGNSKKLTYLQCNLISSETDIYRELLNEDKIPTKIISLDQTNTSLVLGSPNQDRGVLKLYRKIEAGTNPELEVGLYFSEINAKQLNSRFLSPGPTSLWAPKVDHEDLDGQDLGVKSQNDDADTEGQPGGTSRQPTIPISKLKGWFSVSHPPTQQLLLATLHSFIPNEGDAWTMTLRSVGVYLEKVVPTIRDFLELDPGQSQLVQMAAPDKIPEKVNEIYGNILPLARMLGLRCADLHLALAANPRNQAFAIEPVTQLTQRSLYQSMRTTARRTISQLRRQLNHLDDDVKPLAFNVITTEDDILEQLFKVVSVRAGFRIRTHGDLHLGQVLFTGNDYVFIDFEGEPGRSMTERRLKRSPLSDVAGMLRSYHYASHTGIYQLKERGSFDESIGIDRYRYAADLFSYWSGISFLSGYLATIKDSGLLSPSLEEVNNSLAAHLIDKALYEVRYELAHRPTWLRIPLVGVLSTLDTLKHAT